jgi:hypothetical protein
MSGGSGGSNPFVSFVQKMLAACFAPADEREYHPVPIAESTHNDGPSGQRAAPPPVAAGGRDGDDGWDDWGEPSTGKETGITL